MKSRTTDMFEYLLAHGIDMHIEPDPFNRRAWVRQYAIVPDYQVWACGRSDDSRGEWLEGDRAPEIINGFKRRSVTKKGPDLAVLALQLLLEFGFEEEFVNRGLECVSEVLGS